MLMPRFLGLNDSSSSSGSHGAAGVPVSSASPPTTVAAHTKMRLLSKVEQNMRQSQGHIPSHQTSGQDVNHLLHTASTGNGVVGDVDGLLTPMRIKAHLSPPYSANSSGKSESMSSSSRPERNLWSRAEMLEMLSIMQNLNALEQLNDRNMKSEHVFRQIEDVMRSKGYVKKSSIQIWTKWKFLKSTYNTTTRHGTGVPKVVPEEVYRVLCRMLRDTNYSGSSSNVNGSLSECGNSMDSTKTVGEEPKEDILGVEHPIFGFRLGPIKPEPIDTGYETSQKPDMVSEPDMEAFDYEAESSQTDNHDQEEVPHLPFIVSVKHEPDMDLGMDTTNTPPPTAPASPSPPPVALDETDDDLPYSSTPVSALPPLRVASFAKDELRRPTHGILQIDRPPPTLTKMGHQIPSPGQASRSMPLQSTSSINFVHPHSKLMLPRKQNPNNSQPGLRLPRDISVQPTGMRMKTVPMRDTGYSLRPERMIPDLDQVTSSPPQSPMAALLGRGPPPKYPMAGQQSGASTSRQAHMMSSHQLTPQQHQQLQPRKRRLGQSPVMGMPVVPVKLQRSSNMYESTPKGIRSQSGIGEESKKKTSEEESKQRKKRQEDLFAKELSQLATAMRSAQKEMLQDFFMQQKEIARREHEFQLKQDTMVMRALRKQTDVLLKTANELANGTSEAAKSEPEPKHGAVPETQMSVEPETERKILESEEENIDGDGEEDDDVEETMGEPECEDDEVEDEDDNDEEEDDEDIEEDDEEHLGIDSDLEMPTLAMSEGSTQVEVINEEQ
ncbi:LOW QUALITY PROTEIN: uncharacterized protein LOC128251913 [Drosophila gunungcola]|uniref:LOW QUALITY PROTEIN: uncharacterized protein LOC128251913 n=1 Tax=Drosophila gunungcola TaxID=103775 RepID=UPI0022E8DC41|nr:LOW QUALITY PROTEIN: uncharacterized protein LOC128251913 [Drosophila gunungcola]